MPDSAPSCPLPAPGPCPVCGQPLDRSELTSEPPGRAICENCDFILLGEEDEQAKAAQYVEVLRCMQPLDVRAAEVRRFVLRAADWGEPKGEDDGAHIR